MGWPVRVVNSTQARYSVGSGNCSMVVMVARVSSESSSTGSARRRGTAPARVQSSPSRNRSMTPLRVTRPPGAKVPRKRESTFG